MNTFKTLSINSTEDLSDLSTRILIVEDDDISYSLLEEILAAYNISPFRAYDGKEAVDYFYSNKDAFDLVLMDIRLPELNGIRATQLIKDINPSVPIIAVTAYAHSKCILDCYESGCNDYVTKPYDISKIQSLIDMYAISNN